MTKRFFQCDSCKQLFPKAKIKTIIYEYSLKNPTSKEKLVTESMYGMICEKCEKGDKE